MAYTVIYIYQFVLGILLISCQILIYSFHIRSFLFLTSTSVTSLCYFLVDSVTPQNCFTHHFSIPCVAHWLSHSHIHTLMMLEELTCKVIIVTLILMHSFYFCQFFLSFFASEAFIYSTAFPQQQRNGRSRILRRINRWTDVEWTTSCWSTLY